MPLEPRTDTHRPDGLLEVYCWCEQYTVWVPAQDVRAGLTRSCRAYGCGGGDDDLLKLAQARMRATQR